MRLFKLSMYLVLVSLFIITSTLISAVPNNKKIINPNISASQLPNNGDLTIFTKGRQNPNGLFTPDKMFVIPTVDRKYYLQNTIHIKTKEKYIIPKGAKGFHSSILQNSIDDLGVESIRAPFADFTKTQLLSTDKFGIGKVYEVAYSAPVDPYDVCRDLMNNPEIEYAVPVFIQYTDVTPNDPNIGQQWAVNKIQMKEAWDISKGSKDVLIAIVDSGTDVDHEDLKDHIWKNPNEIAGNGVDDDGNGKIDDVNGWDFIGNITANEALNGISREDNNPKPSKTNNFHGTHVAGCASAVTDNGKGIAGTGFNCSLIPIKCSSDNGSVKGIYRGYEAILYAASLGAHIINCSWGGPGNSPLAQDIINQVVEMGAIVVVASGNGDRTGTGFDIDPGTYFPASYDNVLCVGATKSNDKVTGFSNFGQRVTVYAPGAGVRATMPSNNYGNQSGTSMACPITSGVVGLLKAAKPNWSPKQIIHQIRSTSDNVVASLPSLRKLYYGRINAFKALDYNGHNPALNVPGVELTDMEMVGKSALEDYEKTTIKFSFTNFLSTVSNLKVTITPIHNYYKVSQSSINVGILTSNQTKEFYLDVELLENNPWFHGEAVFLLTYESGIYVDYELIRIPIRLQTSHAFNNVYAFQDWLDPQWYAASSSSANNLWAVGWSPVTRGMFYRYASGMQSFNKVSDDPAYAVTSFDNNRAYVGTASGSGKAHIHSTVNGGVNWTTKEVSVITTFVNDIKFFDDNTGIFLGDPIGSVWGIGRTDNGGENWSKATGVPGALNGESGYAGSSYWLEENGWFGTSKGRVYRTTNSGKNWAVSTVHDGGVVYYMGFQDDQKGIAIYSESSGIDASRLVASTSNGGATWIKDKFDFTAQELNPVYLFSPPESEKICALFEGGEVYSTKTSGTKWEPILTYQSIGALTGSAVTNIGYSMRLWNCALMISTLDFDYIPPNAKREITILSGSAVDFDSVDIGANKTSTVDIENTGDVTVNFSSITITLGNGVMQDEFSFVIPPPTSINVGRTSKIRLKFVPESEGEKTATLNIFSDATQGNNKIDLIGVGKTFVSVLENDISNGIYLEQNVPNPSIDETVLAVNLLEPAESQLDIFNSSGKYVKTVYKGNLSVGRNEISLSTASLASGVYYFRLRSGDKTVSRSFVVNR